MPRVTASTNSNDQCAVNAEETLRAIEKQVEQTLQSGIAPARRSLPSEDTSQLDDPAATLAPARARSSNTAPETLSAHVDETQQGARRLASPCESAAHEKLAALPTGWERYERLETLGQGGCGVVYRAFDRQLEREVVIKQIVPGIAGDDELRRRFWHEALITGALEHPGITPVHEAGEDPQTGEAFYAMKWLKGETLHEAITKLHQIADRPTWLLSLRELLERFVAVCQTLAYAHQQSVIHRDIKAANIMLGDYGETVVLDWGIAKRLAERSTFVSPISNSETNTAARVSASRDQDFTRLGDLVGTPSAMSPEQASGVTAKLDHRSDLFSLGSLLYEILTGASAFRASDTSETLANVRAARFEPCRKRNPRVPRPLASICEKALQLKPEDRFNGALELAEQIKKYLAGERVDVHAERWWEAADRWIRKHRQLTWAAVVSLAVLALGASIALTIVRSAQQRETLAHGQTLKQLSASRQASDEWLIGTSGDLQYYPGLEQLRIELLAKAQRHYEQLIATDSPYPEHRLESAKARIRLADLHQLQGSSESAHSEFRIALDELQSIEPQLTELQQQDARLQQANAHIGLAVTTTDETQAQNDLSKASDLLEQLCRISPSDEVDNAKVRCALVQARLLKRSNKLIEAAQTLETIESLARRLYESKADARHRHLYTTLLSELASLEQSLERYSEANLVDQSLIDVYSQAIETSPRADLLEGRAIALVRQGNGWLMLAENDNARECYELAINDYHRAWELLYGVAFYSESIGTVLANLSQLEAQSGETTVALDHYREAIDWLREAIESEGANRDRIERMASCYLGLAELLDVSDPERLELLDQTTTLIEHLESADVISDRTRSLRERLDSAMPQALEQQ